MHNPNRRSRLPCALAVAGLLVLPLGDTRAQTCPLPATLTPNVPAWFNACTGGNDIMLACGLFPLTGPTTVVRMPLPYPTGRLVVQSLTPGYEPAMFLQRSPCNNTSPCGYAALDTMNLASVDSGDYFLVVGPIYPESAACGQIFITHQLTPQEQELAADGVFRGGNSVPQGLP